MNHDTLISLYQLLVTKKIQDFRRNGLAPASRCPTEILCATFFPTQLRTVTTVDAVPNLALQCYRFSFIGPKFAYLLASLTI